MVQLDRPQMTIRRMRFAYSMYKATYTLTEYATLLAFPRQQQSCERATMLRCANIACLVYFCLVHKMLFTADLRILTHEDRFLITRSYFRMIMDHISSRLLSVTCVLISMHRIKIVVQVVLLGTFLVNRSVVISRGIPFLPYENQPSRPSICDANSDRAVIFLQEKSVLGSRR